MKKPKPIPKYRWEKSRTYTGTQNLIANIDLMDALPGDLLASMWEIGGCVHVRVCDPDGSFVVTPMPVNQIGKLRKHRRYWVEDNIKKWSKRDLREADYE